MVVVYNHPGLAREQGLPAGDVEEIHRILCLDSGFKARKTVSL